MQKRNHQPTLQLSLSAENRHVNFVQQKLDAETKSPAYPPAFTQSVIKMVDLLIWTGPRLRPWAPKLLFLIRKLLQFNDFVSDRSPTPAVSSETYVFLFSICCSFVSVRPQTIRVVVSLVTSRLDLEMKVEILHYNIASKFEIFGCCVVRNVLKSWNLEILKSQRMSSTWLLKSWNVEILTSWQHCKIMLQSWKLTSSQDFKILSDYTQGEKFKNQRHANNLGILSRSRTDSGGLVP